MGLPGRQAKAADCDATPKKAEGPHPIPTSETALVYLIAIIDHVTLQEVTKFQNPGTHGSVAPLLLPSTPCGPPIACRTKPIFLLPIVRTLATIRFEVKARNRH
jgi:hypothetical protein